MSDKTQANLTAEDPELDHDDQVIGQALRWSLVIIAVVAGLGMGVVYFLLPDKTPPPPVEAKLSNVETRQATEIEIPAVTFTDITKQAGIDFVQQNGASDEKLLPETMGGGCAFFDFDNDGDQDLLLTNSCVWPWNRGENHQPSLQALYENDGTGKFTNVIAGSGLDIECYGMGVAVGDYDGDSLVDVYLTAVGRNYLFRNLGHGKFQEVASQAGVAGGEDVWGTSCGWFDYDKDGDLDLFVCNYLDWKRPYDTSQNFQLTGGERAYGRPQNFGGTFPYLFQNQGDGTFTDVTQEAGLQIRDPVNNVPLGKSLGVVMTDLDHDGWIDLIVSNDTVQNFLFHNQGDGTFQEQGSLSGIAFDDNGNARGAMGIDIGTFRNTNDAGVVIGNFSNEMTALYVADESGMLFVDEAVATGLGPQTRLQLTFGVFFFDYDSDGKLDLLAANGHLERDIHRVQESQHYEQPPQLFKNCGPEQATEFIPVPEDKCGSDLVKPMVGRGSSFADIDNDGDLDVVIAGLGGPPRLLRNDANLPANWVRLKLDGGDGNTGALGAVVELTAGGQTLRRQVMPTRSYLSQVELPLTFGLGTIDKIDSIKILWPDGTIQEVPPLPVNQFHTITKST
ncbi:CRTAC1 family protein [Bremerella cremea]|uniref:CRTAC1 family protein n=1 Tax=Bremerella cremea TaxID=1031537 RepID=A0A368KUE4_9BACT|nr:CRTAC1 family protein [Bremerella cremea]RCS54050.1 CRTAC1 family protein [Bremerella cremea]